MNIDKNMLQSLASLDDAALTAAIRMIASSSGLELGNAEFSSAALSALRSALRGADDADIAKAQKIFEGFKHGRK